MGIVDEDIAKVRAASDFVALAGEHLALRRVGTRWVGLCPFHSEKSPSFSVNAELGMYYCFGCGAKGDVITFLREMEHLDFVEAVQKLADRAGIALRFDSETAGRDHQRKSRIYEILDQAIGWYHDRLLSSPDAKGARAYLRRERGYDGDVVRRYRLGWAPEGWDQLIKSLGVPAPALVDAGLATVDDSGRYTDFFRGRILFPIYESSGKPVGAGGRLLPGGRGPKYKNTAGTAVYDKSRVLYGLHWAKKSIVEKDQVVVCEGYTDVIGLHLAGVTEAVATCGTALADGHIKLLTGFARRIVLAYDADAAGQAAADRYYDWENRYQVDIRVVALPGGSDPGELSRTDPEGLRRAVEDARPYLGFRLDRLMERFDLANPEGRARAAQEAVGLIAGHPNELVRDQYLMQVAGRCRVEVDALRRMSVAGGPQSGQAPVRSAAGASGPAPVVVSGPELEALRLAVHRPGDVARRLHRVLFTHPVAASAFTALSNASSVHDAIDAADPQTAELLQRLAVEESGAEPDDVLIRLVERATHRAIDELKADMRQADPATQTSYPPTIAWLKLALETMKTDDVARRQAAMEAEERLVGWIVAREESADEASGGRTEATA